LGIDALSTPPKPEDTHDTLLEFPDNRLLIDLCGQFDRNLAQVEHQLDVQILRRGNQLAIHGEPPAREQAAHVLMALYARLESGRPVEAGDIDAEIRMGGGPEADLIDAQMELFKSGRVEIKTRKKLVEPRTEAQKAYVQALFKNELAFGIGPAGTGKTYLAVAVAVNMFIGGHPAT
jgi:phosphate starvation-inducible PhoH-like protein